MIHLVVGMVALVIWSVMVTALVIEFIDMRSESK
jgi:hypothetical protein